MRIFGKTARVLLAVVAAAATTITVATSVTKGASAQSPSDVIFTDAPGTGAPPPTLGPYTMAAFPRDAQSAGAAVSGAKGPNGTVGFSPSLTHCLTGGCWQTWSNGYTGDIYSTSTDSVTLTLPASAKAFYFYAEPDQFMTFTMSATADDGTTSGPVAVAGFAGAEYFGFYTTRAASLKSITVTASDPDGFAVGEFGISDCAFTTPAKWTTEPVAGLTPGAEPLNVVISGCSDVSLNDIRAGLSGWGSVDSYCLSPEQANVTGTDASQQQSWRRESSGLGSALLNCVAGNHLSLTGAENHARFWNQPVKGSLYGAWFASASYETLCVSDGKDMVLADDYNDAQLAVFWKYGLLWHCIDGSQGSIGSDGYNRGARDFVGAIQAAAQEQGQPWSVDVQTIQVAPGTGEGHAGTGVPFNGTVYVVTVDHATS